MKMQTFEPIGKMIKLYFYDASLRAFQYERTEYDHWSISSFSNRFVDLRYVIADFILVAFITSSCLSDPKSRIFVNTLFSKSRWRVLCYEVDLFRMKTYEKFPSNILKRILKIILQLSQVFYHCDKCFQIACR